MPKKLTKDQEKFMKLVVGRKAEKGLNLDQMFARLSCPMTNPVYYRTKDKPAVTTVEQIRGYIRLFGWTDAEILEFVKE